MKIPDVKGNRRSIRVRGYDYSQSGAYFVTIRTHKGEFLFGEIIEGAMKLNEYGRTVEHEWERSSGIRSEIELDSFVVMPNHFHGIVFILGDANRMQSVGATGRSPLPPRGPKPQSLGSLIAGFKSAVSKRINAMRGTPGASLWQRNYYEHIIRDEDSLNRIREYIMHNPLSWSLDRENPLCKGKDEFDLWLAKFRSRPDKK